MALVNKHDKNGTELHTADTVDCDLGYTVRRGWVMAKQYKSISVVKVRFSEDAWQSVREANVTLVRRYGEFLTVAEQEELNKGAQE